MGAPSFFCQEDFLSVGVRIAFRNLVSQTLVDFNSGTTDGEKAKFSGENSGTVQLLEMSPTGFTLSVPKNTCAAGHDLELRFEITNLETDRYSFDIRGKVKSLERASRDQDRIDVELKDSADESWREFCRAFSKRQESIEEFFRSVKGYG